MSQTADEDCPFDRLAIVCYERAVMAIRFVIGRAGTGKTHFCVEAIRTELRKDPIDGPKLVFLVPEQAGLQMERTILDAREIPGAHRAEVTSFQRLAFKILETTGAPERQALSEPARAMVLQHLATLLAGQLKYYRRLDRQTGLVEQLGATITELIQEAVDPDDLAIDADDHAVDPIHSAKLHDIRLIYAAYLDYLGDEHVDPTQYLQVARSRLPECNWLVGAQLWVDGFASMSGQETLTLIELAKVCRSVDITVLMDPRLCEGSASAGTERMYRRTFQTYGDMHRRLNEAGLEVTPPHLLKPACPPRFTPETTLARIESDLFRAAGGSQTSTPAVPDDLALIAAPSRRIEVEHAVAKVCEWVRQPAEGIRYRDVALIVRDLEPYHELFSSALRARGIPFFIDRRRPIAHHPLVELLRAATAMAAESMSIESIQLAMKTGLTPVSDTEADELENYLIAHGVAGRPAWSGPDWTNPRRSATESNATNDKNDGSLEALDRINKTRHKLMNPFQEWLVFAAPDKDHTGTKWAEALGSLIERLSVERSLESWATAAEETGDADQAAEHRQVWRDVSSFLDDLGSALATHMLSVDRLARLLETGLANLTLGLAPPMIDQVLVSSIERSRHPEIKAAVVLGFNDGVFPKRHNEDSILNDDDRVLLRDRGVRVGALTRDRVIDESLLVYIALSRAGRHLVITYALSDDDGKPLRPSPFVGALQAACPGLAVQTIGEPVADRVLWDIQTEQDLTRRIVMEFRERPTLKQDEPETRKTWNELYSSVRGQLREGPRTCKAMTALRDPQPAQLTPTDIAAWAGETFRTSVSQLENYATCPFKYFGQYMLSLRERQTASLAPLDVGHIHHAVLDEFVGELAVGKRGFGQLDESELMDRLEQSCRRVSGRLSRDAWPRARDAYLLKRSRGQLARVMRAQRAAAQSGSASPRGTEVPFGFDKTGSLPALELSTPAGRRVLLRGYIDRVDIAEIGDELLGIVIDYKLTKDKKLALNEVYHGLSLQLLGYLLALAEHGRTLTGRPIQPIAALYVSLAPRYVGVDHPSELSPRDAELGGTYRPRGLLLAERFDALDASGDTGWSRHYGYYRKADGSAGSINSGDAADDPGFQALLRHTRAKLGLLADGILDGHIPVKPYRLGTSGPCSWCALPEVCRFEMGISDVRYLDKLERSDVFQRLTANSG